MLAAFSSDPHISIFPKFVLMMCSLNVTDAFYLCITCVWCFCIQVFKDKVLGYFVRKKRPQRCQSDNLVILASQNAFDWMKWLWCDIRWAEEQQPQKMPATSGDAFNEQHQRESKQGPLCCCSIFHAEKINCGRIQSLIIHKHCLICTAWIHTHKHILDSLFTYYSEPAQPSPCDNGNLW